MMNRGKQPKDKLQLVLDELKVTYVSPVQFENCRTKQGTKLPFDALVTVNGRVGIVMVDGKDHFVSSDDAELLKQREKDQIRNCYARDNNLSILRIVVANGDADVKTYVASFVTALKQSQNNIAFVMLSNPAVYVNFYGDNTMPQLAIIQQQEDYSVSSQPQPQPQPLSQPVSALHEITLETTAAMVSDVKQSDVKDTKPIETKDTKNEVKDSKTVNVKDSKPITNDVKDGTKDPKTPENNKSTGCYIQ